MSNGNTASTNQPLLMIVVALALAFALNEVLPDDAKPWILITLSLLSMAYVLRRFLLETERGKLYRTYLQNLDRSYYWIGLGTLLLLIGILTRFAPKDVGIVLSSIGVLVLLGSVIYFLRTNRVAITQRATSLHGEFTENQDHANKSFASSFKEKVTEEVLGHARRASILSFSVAVGLFIIGLGIFLFIAINIYQLLNGEAGSLLFSNYLGNYLNGYRAGVPDIQNIGLLFLVQILAFFPILGLIGIGWIGSKFIIHATHFSQRKVIQDTLAEIGPLDAILEGVAIQQPPVESMQRRLRQAQRALAARRFISTLAFLVGLGLLGWLLAEGTLYGFKDYDKIITWSGVRGGLLLFALLYNNPLQSRRALQDISALELNITQHTQRAQIINLYVAHLAKDGFKNQNIQDIKKALEQLDALSWT